METKIEEGQIWRAKNVPAGQVLDLLLVERIEGDDLYCRGVMTGKGLVMQAPLLRKWGVLETEAVAS